MRECRSTLRVLTGTLAGAEVAKQERVEQLFTDGTKRRQIDLENILIGYFSENGFRTIVLNSAVIPEEENQNQYAHHFCEHSIKQEIFLTSGERRQLKCILMNLSCLSVSQLEKV